MNDLLIPADAQGKTPSINFKLSGSMAIEGRSILENVFEHYQPAIDWINNLRGPLPNEINLTVRLEYFNTRSSKMLLTILKSLESIHLSARSKVTVTWLYVTDDRDMFEAGHDYQSVVKIPFKIMSISEN